jgi:hypothetical protein
MKTSDNQPARNINSQVYRRSSERFFARIDIFQSVFLAGTETFSSDQFFLKSTGKSNLYYRENTDPKSQCRIKIKCTKTRNGVRILFEDLDYYRLAYIPMFASWSDRYYCPTLLRCWKASYYSFIFSGLRNSAQPLLLTAPHDISPTTMFATTFINDHIGSFFYLILPCFDRLGRMILSKYLARSMIHCNAFSSLIVSINRYL